MFWAEINSWLWWLLFSSGGAGGGASGWLRWWLKYLWSLATGELDIICVGVEG